MTVHILVIPFHIVWCEIFVYKLGYGMIGCAMAINVTYILCFIVLCILVKFVPDEEVKKAWVPFDLKKAYTHKDEYLDLTMSTLLL